jgi:hypothetical protein
MVRKVCGVAIAVAAAIACVVAPVQAQAAPLSVFACSLGKKTVSVTAEGNQLTYVFGTPGHPDISIVGRSDKKNVLYREDRYAGMEHQLRFVNGDYSYMVYNMEGNGNTGVKPVSGLIVMKGSKTIADMSCTHYAEFATGFNYESLPQDTVQW